MSRAFAAPRTIRRIAARRMFKAPGGKPVVVTLGVPQALRGSDWGCPLQITGLNTIWHRPKYVFGIDGLQALHLAMKCADTALQSAKLKLEWLGQTEDLGMPKFLPALPKPQQDRLEAMVEREAATFWRSVERAHKAKNSQRRNGPRTADQDRASQSSSSRGRRRRRTTRLRQRDQVQDEKARHTEPGDQHERETRHRGRRNRTGQVEKEHRHS